MDRHRIHAWLSIESYWAVGRTRQVHDAAMDGSLNFGMFHTESGAQVAYARVVTDSVTFAWLCDVFVDPSVRGSGVGKELIAGVRTVLDPLGLKRTLLTTADAHGLYSQFGFGPLPDPTIFMTRP